VKHWIAALLLFAAVADEKSARTFVQDFYTRYMTKHLTEESVLAAKPSPLATTLQRALKEDYDASAKSKDEIVGLDFDPFLNSQDPCERYDAGKVTLHGSDRASVEVFSVCEGKRVTKPDVVAEVVFANGRWQFDNFGYPDSRDDLRSVLKKLKDSRK
jgi:hypothetical protein